MTEPTPEIATHELTTDGATIVYDVRGPLPPAGGRPPLVLIGQPMDASGFVDLAGQFPDRTVITYDPRGLGRSTPSDGLTVQTPERQAADVHAIVEAVGGPVDLFGSSGGAITSLALVQAYPDDVVTLVAHEPPLIRILPDADAAERARDGFYEAYQQHGFGAGMAAFIAMTSWRGDFTEAYFAQPAPDPAQFGMPTEDDGKRDDALLSRSAVAILEHQPDVGALKAGPMRIVLGVSEEGTDTLAHRGGATMAALLGDVPVVFPSHHGGFAGGGPDNPYAGKPEEFAKVLREVLDAR